MLAFFIVIFVVMLINISFYSLAYFLVSFLKDIIFNREMKSNITENSIFECNIFYINASHSSLQLARSLLVCSNYAIVFT